MVKILAVAAILSRVGVALSDLAYAGTFYHLLLSASAHINVRKRSGAVPTAVGLVLLVAAFLTQNAARETPSPYVQAAAEHRMDSYLMKIDVARLNARVAISMSIKVGYHPSEVAAIVQRLNLLPCVP